VAPDFVRGCVVFARCRFPRRNATPGKGFFGLAFKLAEPSGPLHHARHHHDGAGDKQNSEEEKGRQRNMALKSYKPTTPGQRGLVTIDRSSFRERAPQSKVPTQRFDQSGGPNTLPTDQTMRRTGGGQSRLTVLARFQTQQAGPCPPCCPHGRIDPNRTAIPRTDPVRDGDRLNILAHSVSLWRQR